MASPAVIGDLVVKIGADVSGLAKGAAEAESTMGRLGKGIAGTMKVAVASALAAASALALMTQQSMAQIDSQVKLSERLGSSVTAVQTLTYAADLAGIGFEQMSGAADMLNRKLGEAIRDSMSPAADAFRRLGLSARELSQMDADKRFASIADAIKRAGLNGSQTADVLRQMGIRGGDFVTLMRKGGDEIRNARNDIVAFGVAVSDVDAKQIEIANDAMTTLGLVAKGVGNQFAVAVAPAVQAVAGYFADASRGSKGWGETVEWAVGRAVVSFGAVKSVIQGIRIIWDEAVAGILDGINWIIRGWNKIANTIPGMSKAAVDEISHDYGKLWEQLGDPPRQAEWEAWWDNQKKKAKETAQAAVDAQKALGKGPKGGEVLSSQERKQLEEKFQRLQQAIAKEDEALKLQQQKQLKDLEEFYKKGVITKQQYDTTKLQIEEAHQDKMRALILSKLEEGILTEQELLTRKHALQMQAITDFENNKTITAQQANELRLAHAREHALQMAQITARQYSHLAGIVDTSLGAISGIITDQNSKAFKAMKVISTATALVKGYEAMVSAYAAGARIGGPALGSVFAGIAAAGTAAIIAKIHGVGQSSTGTVSAPASAQVPATAEANNSQTLYIKGLDRNAIFSGSQVRQLAEELLEYQANGGKVVRFAQ